MPGPQPPGGEPGRGVTDMTTTTLTNESTTSLSLVGVGGAILTALVLLYFTGFAEAAKYHDSAHDTRHTLAFPCH